MTDIVCLRGDVAMDVMPRNESAHRWRPLRGSRIANWRCGTAIRCSACFGFHSLRRFNHVNDALFFKTLMRSHELDRFPVTPRRRETVASCFLHCRQPPNAVHLVRVALLQLATRHLGSSQIPGLDQTDDAVRQLIQLRHNRLDGRARTAAPIVSCGRALPIGLQAAFLVLSAAAARAGIIATYSCHGVCWLAERQN
jgi:hypothetical protein